MPAKSKAQFKYIMAHKDKFGSEWTDNVDYSSLPSKKGKSSKRQTVGTIKTKRKHK